jgi:hypothetical protein
VIRIYHFLWKRETRKWSLSLCSHFAVIRRYQPSMDGKRIDRGAWICHHGLSFTYPEATHPHCAPHLQLL